MDGREYAGSSRHVNPSSRGNQKVQRLILAYDDINRRHASVQNKLSTTDVRHRRHGVDDVTTVTRSRYDDVRVKRHIQDDARDKIQLMKRLHVIDQELVSFIRSDSRSMLKGTSMDDLASHTPLHKRFDSVQEGTMVPTGSTAEGAMVAASFKSEESRSDLDYLVILGTINEKDRGVKFDYTEESGVYRVYGDKSNRLGSFIDIMSATPQLYSLMKAEAAKEGEVLGSGIMSAQRHGPAVAVSVANPMNLNEVVDVMDQAFAYKLDFWPPEALSWFVRGRKWPPPYVIKEIRRLPVCLVHKPSSPDPEHQNEWYPSFTLVEQTIAHRRTEGMKFTYLVFKSIFYRCFNFKVENKEFGSYLPKTTMNWACDRLDPDEWTEHNLERNLCFLFRMLTDGIQRRFLPHYFMPELNLLRHLPPALFAAMNTMVNVENLANNPLAVLPDSTVIKRVISKHRTTRSIIQQHEKDFNMMFDGIIKVYNRFKPGYGSLCQIHSVKTILFLMCSTHNQDYIKRYIAAFKLFLDVSDPGANELMSILSSIHEEMGEIPEDQLMAGIKEELMTLSLTTGASGGGGGQEKVMENNGQLTDPTNLFLNRTHHSNTGDKVSAPTPVGNKTWQCLDHDELD